MAEDLADPLYQGQGGEVREEGQGDLRHLSATDAGGRPHGSHRRPLHRDPRRNTPGCAPCARKYATNGVTGRTKCYIQFLCYVTFKYTDTFYKWIRNELYMDILRTLIFNDLNKR